MKQQSAPLVYILTLNWNGMADTLGFAAECRRQTYSNLRVLVVDNASSDGSMEALAAQFPEVERLYNPENWGFPRAMNVGLRHALSQGADYVFVANNDTLLAPIGSTC
ncbi:glycosyltransferase [Candidatus Gracilibacteria bacterium]|nr:glycosyltransferase [Candidatus Gracilibacteria bacterium]